MDIMKHEDAPGGHAMLRNTKRWCRMEGGGLYLQEDRDTPE